MNHCTCLLSHLENPIHDHQLRPPKKKHFVQLLLSQTLKIEREKNHCFPGVLQHRNDDIWSGFRLLASPSFIVGIFSLFGYPSRKERYAWRVKSVCGHSCQMNLRSKLLGTKGHKKESLKKGFRVHKFLNASPLALKSLF